MIVLDTSGLLAALDEAEPQHRACCATLAAERPPLLLSPFVLAELDYLLVGALGHDAELAVLGEVAEGRYQLADVTPVDIGAAREVVARYRDLGVGLTDASIVVLADRYGTDRVLTLDERHFRALRASDGRPFMLLPADS